MTIFPKNCNAKIFKPKCVSRDSEQRNLVFNYVIVQKSEEFNSDFDSKELESHSKNLEIWWKTWRNLGISPLRKSRNPDITESI